MTQPELDAAVKGVTSKVKGDAGVWFAYPKQSSKRYTSTINRDSGWDSLGKAGFESVRMVAIDEDWSARAVSPRGIHQDDEARRGVGDVEGRQGEGGEEK